MIKKILFLLLTTHVWAGDFSEVALWYVDGEDTQGLCGLALKMRSGSDGVEKNLWQAFVLQIIAAELDDKKGAISSAVADVFTGSSPFSTVLTKDAAMLAWHENYYRQRAARLGKESPALMDYLASLARDHEKNIPVEEYFKAENVLDRQFRNEATVMAIAYLAGLRFPDHPLPCAQLAKLFTVGRESIAQPVHEVAFAYISRAYEFDERYKQDFVDICQALSSTTYQATRAGIILANARESHASERVRAALSMLLDAKCVVS